MRPWGVCYCVLNLLCMVFLLCMFIHKCAEVRMMQELLDARTETCDEQYKIIQKLLKLRGITDAE